MFDILDRGEKITEADTLDSAKNAADSVFAYYNGDPQVIDLMSNKDVYSSNPGGIWRNQKA